MTEKCFPMSRRNSIADNGAVQSRLFATKAPFGVKSGLLPILIACFYKANEDKYALYEKVNNQSESFITDFTEQIADKFSCCWK